MHGIASHACKARERIGEHNPPNPSTRPTARVIAGDVIHFSGISSQASVRFEGLTLPLRPPSSYAEKSQYNYCYQKSGEMPPRLFIVDLIQSVKHGNSNEFLVLCTYLYDLIRLVYVYVGIVGKRIVGVVTVWYCCLLVCSRRLSCICGLLCNCSHYMTTTRRNNV